MATFSVTTTQEQDRAITYATQLRNANLGQGETPLQPVDVAREYIAHTLNGVVQTMQQAQTAGRGDLYNRASDADKATIDALLNQYR